MSTLALSEAKQRLLEKYQRGRIATGSVAPLIAPRPPGEPVPLSLSQEQLVFREQSKPGIPPLYNECITLRMEGSLDVPILERSLAEIIRRHEIWRTSYETRGGQQVQMVHRPPNEIHLSVIDLELLTQARRELEAQRIIGEVVRQPFDLSGEPLWRARLVKMNSSEHRLFIIAHLSIVDGVSVYQILLSELAALYRAYSSGQTSPLRDLPLQFGDYAYWQRRWLFKEELTKQINYWRKQLAGQLPVLEWPPHRPRLAMRTFRGAILPFSMPKVLSDAVKQLSQQEGVSLFVTLLAAFTTLLHSYTQQDDIIVGTLSPAGRERFGVEGLLGHFLNPVALRFDLSGAPTFRELLLQAQRLTLEAISNDDVPLEALARELELTPDANCNPPFTVAISLQPPMPNVGLPWSVTSMDVDSGGAPWDLYVAFIDRPTGMMGRVQYNPDLFETETIAQMLRHFEQVFESVSMDRLKRLSELQVA